MTKPTDLVQGTLDLLIMRTIATESLHGWAIAQRIQLLSKDVLRVNQGSLYPALQRLERQGWITADWGVADTNRRARFYRLTAPGRHLARPPNRVARQESSHANRSSDPSPVSCPLPQRTHRRRPRRGDALSPR